VTTAYGFLGADTLDKGESADASNRDTYVADPLQRTCIELVGVKQAWSIKNYRYVCNVSTSLSLTPARPRVGK
jgi:hypothetical protein